MGWKNPTNSPMNGSLHDGKHSAVSIRMANVVVFWGLQ